MAKCSADFFKSENPRAASFVCLLENVLYLDNILLLRARRESAAKCQVIIK